MRIPGSIFRRRESDRKRVLPRRFSIFQLIWNIKVFSKGDKILFGRIIPPIKT